MNSLTVVSRHVPNFDAMPYMVLAVEPSLRQCKIYLDCKKGIKNNESIIPLAVLLKSKKTYFVLSCLH